MSTCSSIPGHDAASSSGSAVHLYEDDDLSAAEHFSSPDASPSKWRRAGSSKHNALSVGYSESSRPLGSVPSSPGGTGGYKSARSHHRSSQQGLSTTSDGGYSSSDVSVGVLSMMRQLQRSFEPSAQEAAAKKLFTLASRDAVIRGALATPRHVSNLLMMAQSVSRGCQLAAISLLWLVTNKNPAAARMVAHAQGIPAVLPFLQDSSQLHRRAAAFITCQLLEESSLQAELLKGDWVSSLTGLLYVNDPAVLPPAVVSVHRLAASHDPLARQEVLKAGGLHGLVRLLKGDRPAVAPKHLPRILSSAAAAVGRLSEHPEGLAVAESAEAAAGLAAALVSGTPAVREAATAALRQLVRASGVVKAQVLRGEGLEPLLDVLHVGTLRAQSAAADILRLLAASSQGPHEASMGEGAAHLLAKLTQGYPDESSSLQAATRLALALSAWPGSRDRLIDCGCVRSLAWVAARATTSTATLAIKALVNLTSSSTGRAAFLGCGAPCVIIKAAHVSATTPAMVPMCHLLANAARPRSKRAALLATPDLPKFLVAASHSSCASQEAVLPLLHRLTGKGFTIEAVADAGVPAVALHIMLTTNAATASEEAIDVLNRFAMAGKLAQQHLASVAAHLP